MRDFDDVVVMNSQRVSSSIGNGFYFGAYGSGRYTGTNSGSSSTYWNVCLMKDGRIVLVFNDVQDPHGVKRMIQALNKVQAKIAKKNMSEEGLNDYCSRIKLRAMQNCGLSENDFLLKAVKNGEMVSFQFNLSSQDVNTGITRFRCLASVIKQTLPEMPVITRSVFETLLSKIEQEALLAVAKSKEGK